MSKQKINPKCEATEWAEKKECGNKARFKIVDFECGNEDGDYEIFWVCNDCIKSFILKNEDNPHYIILDEYGK